MSDLQALTKQRDDILAQIKAIEENSEAKINKILEAIKKQRWYFFKNDPKILMDRDTGYLWANLDYFPWNPNKDRTDKHYTFDEAIAILEKYRTNVTKDWKIPKLDDFKEMIEDKSFPFYEVPEGCNEKDHSILKCMNWFCISNHDIFNKSICLWELEPGMAGGWRSNDKRDYSMCLLPYSTQLVDGTNYKQDVSKKNRVYKEKEKLQFTLDLFVNNSLIPVFENREKNGMNVAKFKNYKFVDLDDKDYAVLKPYYNLIIDNFCYEDFVVKEIKNGHFSDEFIKKFKDVLYSLAAQIKVAKSGEDCAEWAASLFEYALHDNHINVSDKFKKFIRELLLSQTNDNLKLCTTIDSNKNIEEINELYKKLYVEKPKLVKQLETLSKQIEDLSIQSEVTEEITLLSSKFDYLPLLAKYDIKAIESSPIRYFQAVQQWIDDLTSQLENYEEKMGNTIREFNSINLNLSKKYEDSSYLTDDENELLFSRQKYFNKLFSVEMVSVKNKLLAIKKQADDLEDKIDRINDGNNALYDLALLEKEERVSFSFLAENTAMILKNALVKVEYFQKNYDFVKASIEIWENWNEDYKVFKTTYNEEMKKFCEDDSIESEVWSKWYEDWRKLRFAIETKLQPIIERGLKSVIPFSQQTKGSVPLLLIEALETYKNTIDKFYLEERKGIYQKFAFQAGGDLQDKFETESELYKRTAAFQSQLQDIIFNCSNTEDRIFILRWANDLLDIQIDEILTFVVDRDLQQISRALLQEFSLLKQKNFSSYLMDVKAYSEEKSRREKEYNSLIFKMRKDLMK